MAKKKILFIINPCSGVNRVKALQTAIADNLDSQQFDYKVVYTQYAKHGTQLAREGVQQGYEIIVAVGGDGSVNDVVNGLYGTQAILGILPKGSGNGFARSLGIPIQTKKALQLLNQNNLREIDVGQADGNLFVSNAGVGFDTVVTDKFRTSKRRGLLSYLWIISKSIWTYNAKKWTITLDGKTEQKRCFMLTAANGVQLGYGFQIAPNAQPDDGYLDWVSIEKFPVLAAIPIAFRAFTGKINRSKYVSYQRVREVKLHHPDLNLLQIDGEALPCQNEIILQIMPKKLKVLV